MLANLTVANLSMEYCLYSKKVLGVTSGKQVEKKCDMTLVTCGKNVQHDSFKWLHLSIKVNPFVYSSVVLIVFSARSRGGFLLQRLLQRHQLSMPLVLGTPVEGGRKGEEGQEGKPVYARSQQVCVSGKKDSAVVVKKGSAVVVKKGMRLVAVTTLNSTHKTRVWRCTIYVLYI